MNKNDSEKMAAILESLGYTEVDTPDGSNLILLNTCSVRGKSESRMYGWLGQLKRLKTNDQRPATIIGVCGCIPQHAKQEIFDRAPHVDLVFGVNNIEHLPELLARVEQGENHVMEILKQKEINDKKMEEGRWKSEEVVRNTMRGEVDFHLPSE